MACDQCIGRAEELEAEGYEYQHRNEERQRRGRHDTFYPDKGSACFEQANLIRAGCRGSGANHAPAESPPDRSASTFTRSDAQGSGERTKNQMPGAAGCVFWIVVIFLVVKFCGH
jgi:hypothetical protein